MYRYREIYKLLLVILFHLLITNNIFSLAPGTITKDTTIKETFEIFSKRQEALENLTLTVNTLKFWNELTETHTDFIENKLSENELKEKQKILKKLWDKTNIPSTYMPNVTEFNEMELKEKGSHLYSFFDLFEEIDNTSELFLNNNNKITQEIKKVNAEITNSPKSNYFNLFFTNEELEKIFNPLFKAISTNKDIEIYLKDSLIKYLKLSNSFLQTTTERDTEFKEEALAEIKSLKDELKQKYDFNDFWVNLPHFLSFLSLENHNKINDIAIRLNLYLKTLDKDPIKKKDFLNQFKGLENIFTNLSLDNIETKTTEYFSKAEKILENETNIVIEKLNEYLKNINEEKTPEIFAKFFDILDETTYVVSPEFRDFITINFNINAYLKMLKNNQQKEFIEQLSYIWNIFSNINETNIHDKLKEYLKKSNQIFNNLRIELLNDLQIQLKQVQTSSTMQDISLLFIILDKIALVFEQENITPINQNYFNYLNGAKTALNEKEFNLFKKEIINILTILSNSSQKDFSRKANTYITGSNNYLDSLNENLNFSNEIFEILEPLEQEQKPNENIIHIKKLWEYLIVNSNNSSVEILKELQITLNKITTKELEKTPQYQNFLNEIDERTKELFAGQSFFNIINKVENYINNLKNNYLLIQMNEFYKNANTILTINNKIDTLKRNPEKLLNLVSYLTNLLIKQEYDIKKFPKGFAREFVEFFKENKLEFSTDKTAKDVLDEFIKKYIEIIKKASIESPFFNRMYKSIKRSPYLNNYNYSYFSTQDNLRWDPEKWNNTKNKYNLSQYANQATGLVFKNIPQNTLDSIINEFTADTLNFRFNPTTGNVRCTNINTLKTISPEKIKSFEKDISTRIQTTKITDNAFYEWISLNNIFTIDITPSDEGPNGLAQNVFVGTNRFFQHGAIYNDYKNNPNMSKVAAITALIELKRKQTRLEHNVPISPRNEEYKGNDIETIENKEKLISIYKDFIIPLYSDEISGVDNTIIELFKILEDEKILKKDENLSISAMLEKVSTKIKTSKDISDEIRNFLEFQEDA